MSAAPMRDAPMSETPMNDAPVDAPPSVLVTIDRCFGAVLRFVPVACLVLLGVILFVNVVGRSSGLFSLTWFDEIVTMTFAWMVFVGAAALWRERSHFALDLVPDLVRGTRWHGLVLLAFAAIGLVFAGALTWYGWIFFARTTATTPVLGWPQAWAYFCIPIGGAVMTIYAVRDLVVALAETLRRPRAAETA